MKKEFLATVAIIATGCVVKAEDACKPSAQFDSFTAPVYAVNGDAVTIEKSGSLYTFDGDGFTVGETIVVYTMEDTCTHEVYVVNAEKLGTGLSQLQEVKK